MRKQWRAQPIARTAVMLVLVAVALSVGSQVTAAPAAAIKGATTAKAATPFPGKPATPPCQDWAGYGTPPNPATNGEFEVLNGVSVAAPCDTWAVGSYDINTCSGAQPLIAHFTGLTWAQVTSPDPGGCNQDTVLNGVASGPKKSAWAVGHYNNGVADQTMILRWDTKTKAWVQETSPNPGGKNNANVLSGVTVNGSNLWAVGYYSNGSIDQPLVEHATVSLTGVNTKWTVVKQLPKFTQNAMLSGVAASSGRVWAVGHTSTSKIPTAALILDCGKLKTGPGCHTVGITHGKVIGPFKGALNGVTATSDTDAWAVGDAPGPGGNQVVLAVHWNGKTWSPSPVRLTLPPPATFLGVASIGTQVWAVGSDSLGNDSLLAYLPAPGKAWTQLASPNTGNDQLDAVSAAAAAGVWAVGQFGNDSGYTTIAIHCC